MNRDIFRYRHLILSLVVGAASFGGLLFGVVPAIQRTIEGLEEIRVLRKDVNEIQTRTAIYQQYSQSALSDDARLVASALPQDKSLASIFSAIDQLVVKTGTTLIDISLANAGSLATESAQLRLDFEKKTGVSIVPITVSLFGSPQGIESFITKAGTSRRFMMVRDFDLSLASDGNLNMRATIDVLYKPLNSSLGKLSTDVTALTNDEEDMLVTLSRIESVSDIGDGQTQLSPGIKGRDDPFRR